MRLLANENFPGLAVQALRRAGHDVEWMRELAPGTADPEVLARAVSEARVLITFDKDFGELAFRRGLPAPTGIVLFRTQPTSAAGIGQLAVQVLGSRSDWPGHFSVVDERRIRMTPLPALGRNGSP